MDIWFRHKSTGNLQFDPGKGHKLYDPWWCFILCDQNITNLYDWFLKKRGISTYGFNRLWGAHISVVKGEKPLFEENWGNDFGLVEFWYTNQIRLGKNHAWIDVFSPQMSDIREKLGLPPKIFFHLTIGRLR